MTSNLNILKLGFILALLSFSRGGPEDDFGVTNAHTEYLTVFRNIPRLFEYLIQTLHERPEILENNDVTIFKRNAEVNENDKNLNAGSEDSPYNSPNDNDNNLETLKVTNDLDEVREVSREIRDLAHEIRALPIKDRTQVGKKSRRNRNVNEGEQSNSVPHGLSSEEIAEKALLVEQMLEDHNDSKNKND